MCGMSFTHHIMMSNHVLNVHGLKMKDYYDRNIKKDSEGICPICKKPTEFINATKGYRECCSVGCSNKLRNIRAKQDDTETETCCAICNVSFKSKADLKSVYTKLFYHLTSVHGINSKKEYYDTYLKKDPNEGICPICGKETTFKSIDAGYNTFCSASCSAKNSKQNENSILNQYYAERDKQSIFKKIVNGIKTKYKELVDSFKTDEAKLSDVRTDVIDIKNITDEVLVDDPNHIGKQIKVKNEFSVMTSTNWVGDQSYIPTTESCNVNTSYRNKYQYYNDIDDQQSFTSNEWC